jgi:hypothetical protein
MRLPLSSAGRGIVERVEDVERHDTASSMIASCCSEASIDHKAEPASNLLDLRCIRRAARDEARTARIAAVAWTASPRQRISAYGSLFFYAVRAVRLPIRRA